MYLAEKAGTHTHNIKAQGIANVEDVLKADVTRPINDAPTPIDPLCPTLSKNNMQKPGENPNTPTVNEGYRSTVPTKVHLLVF